LFSTGGGDRNLGDTGHRGASPGRSGATDGFWGTGVLTVESAGAGGRAGVLDADSVRGAPGAGTVDRDGRDGLLSWVLFLRDLVPAVPVGAALAVFDLMGGRMGDESREAKGEAFVDVDAEGVPESCDAGLGGSVSALRRDEVDDSRVRAGCELWALAAGWRTPAPPGAIFVALSMAAGSMGVAVETREPRPGPHATSALAAEPVVTS